MGDSRDIIKRIEALEALGNPDPGTEEPGDNEFTRLDQDEANELENLRRKLAGPMQTWTFVGHWENDEIVVEYILPGEVQDVREDTGFWEQGLFAESASGVTQEAALETIRDHYESELR